MCRQCFVTISSGCGRCDRCLYLPQCGGGSNLECLRPSHLAALRAKGKRARGADGFYSPGGER